ncbi:unnamed protein product [Gongylonema pulchrum]|uniref:Secreted protein n=1 Tax=Gongylonema pulchrum TaxID=637853 RepID=A0A183DKV1_9BILA|nr:unnamed protein product [Gongylonema pulchrum]
MRIEGALIAAISQLWLISSAENTHDEERKSLAIIRQIRLSPSIQGNSATSTVNVSSSNIAQHFEQPSERRFVDEQRYRTFRHGRRGILAFFFVPAKNC